jgi:alanine racemase
VEYVKTSAEIDLHALSQNLETVKKKTKNKPVIAVVKADAYGHGAVEVSKHLLGAGVSILGVAFVEEAIVLREAGIKAQILVFFDPHTVDSYFKYNLTPVIYDAKNAKAFSDKAHQYKSQLPVHIKVDTGMGRVGVRISEALPEILKITETKNLRVEGLMSHFSDAELQDKDFTLSQQKSFMKLINELKQKNLSFRYYHMANSAAVLRFPESHLTSVRPGIMLYGYGPADKNTLKPVLTLKSKIIFIKQVPAGTSISYGRTFITKRQSTIATIPIGYADGYNRKLSNCGEVIINGQRAPIIGRVCMDALMVDVTEIPNVHYDTDVTLIGQHGNEKISAQDIADKIGTISYEILTTLGKRVKRTYKY